MHHVVIWPCILGCTDCRDEITHYFVCPCLWQIGRERLGLQEDSILVGARLCLTEPSFDKLSLLAFCHTLYHACAHDPDCIVPDGRIWAPIFVQNRATQLARNVKHLFKLSWACLVWTRECNLKNTQKKTTIYIYIYIYIYMYIYWAAMYNSVYLCVFVACLSSSRRQITITQISIIHRNIHTYTHAYAYLERSMSHKFREGKVVFANSCVAMSPALLARCMWAHASHECSHELAWMLLIASYECGCSLDG
jgi:hypothetical protein